MSETQKYLMESVETKHRTITDDKNNEILTNLMGKFKRIFEDGSYVNPFENEKSEEEELLSKEKPSFVILYEEQSSTKATIPGDLLASLGVNLLAKRKVNSILKSIDEIERICKEYDYPLQALQMEKCVKYEKNITTKLKSLNSDNAYKYISDEERTAISNNFKKRAQPYLLQKKIARQEFTQRCYSEFNKDKDYKFELTEKELFKKKFPPLTKELLDKYIAENKTITDANIRDINIKRLRKMAEYSQININNATNFMTSAEIMQEKAREEKVGYQEIDVLRKHLEEVGVTVPPQLEQDAQAFWEQNILILLENVSKKYDKKEIFEIEKNIQIYKSKYEKTEVYKDSPIGSTESLLKRIASQQEPSHHKTRLQCDNMMKEFRAEIDIPGRNTDKNSVEYKKKEFYVKLYNEYLGKKGSLDREDYGLLTGRYNQGCNRLDYIEIENQSPKRLEVRNNKQTPSNTPNQQMYQQPNQQFPLNIPTQNTQYPSNNMSSITANVGNQNPTTIIENQQRMIEYLQQQVEALQLQNQQYSSQTNETSFYRR